MRHSNHVPRRVRVPAWAPALFLMLLGACGQTAAPSVRPTSIPTPAITPDAHLTEPVSADQIFRILGSAKLGMKADHATLGGDPGILKVINADIGNWPLRITEYRSSAALHKDLRWKAGAAPARDEAPFAIAGLNVLVEFGPTGSAGTATAPDAGRQQVAASIVAVLDPLLWPLLQHSVTVAPARTAEPPPSAPSSAKSTKAPARAPSQAPSNAP